MKILLLLLLPGLLAAQQIIGVTATQAVIRYTAPSASACTISITPAAHDVDAAKFANANLDLSRPSTVSSTSTIRTVVIGQQVAEVGSDGVTYSRALAAERSYTVTLCGGMTASFITRSPLVGDIAPRAPAGWPTIDPLNQSKEYIDPITGVQLRAINRAGDFSLRSQSQVLFHGTTGGAGWTSLPNILTDGASFASTTNTNAVVLYPNPNDSPNFFGMLNQGWNPLRVLEDFGARLVVGGDDATASNRQAGVCLTIDGTNCYGTEITITAAQGAPVAQTVPSNFPTAMFNGWGAVPPRESYPAFGTVSCTASVCTIVGSTTSRIGNDATRIFITGSGCPSSLCTIATRTSSTAFTLSDSSITVSNAAFIQYSLGLRIRKLTATGTLQVSASYRTAGVHPPGLRAESNIASRATFTGAGGKTWRLTAIQAVASGSISIYAIADDGTSNFISAGSVGRLSGTPSAPGSIAGNVAGRMLGFDSSNAKQWYIFVAGNDGVSRIYRCTYSGDGTRLDYGYRGQSGGTLDNTDDLVTYTPIMDVSAALAAQGHYSIANYGGGSAFTAAWGIATSGDFAILANNYGSQDYSPMWMMIVRLSTGTIVKLVHTLDGADGGAGVDEMRWGTGHSASRSEFPAGVLITSHNIVGYYEIEGSPSTRRNGGPWKLTITGVMRSGSFDTNTALGWPITSAYDNACPADLIQRWKDAGAVGNQCATLRVSGEPASATTGANDTVTLKEGDVFANRTLALGAGVSQGDFDTEHFRVVRKTSLGGGAWSLVVQRDAIKEYCNFASHGATFRMTHANGWVGQMVPSRDRGCTGTVLFFDAATLANGTAVQCARDTCVNHFATGPSFGAGAMSHISKLGVVDGPLSKLQELPFSPAPYSLTGFAGQISSVANQSYAQRSHFDAPGLPWTTDYSAYLPGNGFSIELSGVLGANTQTEVSTGIVRLTPMGGAMDYKRTPLIGWAGRIQLRENSAGTIGNQAINPYEFCYAYRAGECRTGSSTGQVFVNIPKPDITNTCETGTSGLMSPCVAWATPTGGFAFQRGAGNEVNGSQIQKLTWLNAGPTYSYQKLQPIPDGKWAIGHGGGWTNNHQFAYLVKIPSYRPDSRSTSLGTFTPLVVTVPAGSVIEFGYTPQFYCTARAEACKVSAATITQSAPFSFAHEALSGSAGTTIAIPAIAGRVLYYRIGTGATQVVAP